jgi:signal peptide peptidase SppA
MIRVREALRSAVRDPDVSGIMLRIDSPGGTVAGSAELAADIRKAAARKPLYAYADDLAASGALLALTQARKAYGSPNAEIGSIGVYMVVEDTSQQYQQDGVKVHVISSAPLKGIGVDGTEVTVAQLSEWQRRVADLADWFVAEVATGRKSSKEDVQKLATGQSWVAEKAQAHGLIDGVMTFDEALARLRSEVMAEQEVATALALAQEAELKAETATTARVKAEAETASLKERLAKLEGAQRAELFAAKAKALKLPPAASAVLEAAEKAMGAEAFCQLEVYVKALGAQVDESKLFGEIGTSADGSEGGSAWERIQALAAARVKAGTSKTLADAVSVVAAENKDLYKLHVEEQRKGAR